MALLARTLSTVYIHASSARYPALTPPRTPIHTQHLIPAHPIPSCPLKTPLPVPSTPCQLHTPQLSVPELEWQTRHSRISLQLMSAGARGVYEGQLPLALHAALQLGCVATVAAGARGRPLGDGFDLEELQVNGGDGVGGYAPGVQALRMI